MRCVFVKKFNSYYLIFPVPIETLICKGRRRREKGGSERKRERKEEGGRKVEGGRASKVQLHAGMGGRGGVEGFT